MLFTALQEKFSKNSAFTKDFSIQPLLLIDFAENLPIGSGLNKVMQIMLR